LELFNGWTPNGVPIDDFGQPAGDPTINRASLFVETNRTISQKNRSILFLRYRFEDVRLFKFESLLVKELLRPDARNRISGFFYDIRPGHSAKLQHQIFAARSDRQRRSGRGLPL
jgi:hypothetical protein